MTLYLTGFVIDTTAILLLTGYYVYHLIREKEFVEPKLYLWLVTGSILSITITSVFFLWSGNLALASTLVWLMAIPVVITSLFIVMIIVFRPDWN